MADRTVVVEIPARVLMGLELSVAFFEDMNDLSPLETATCMMIVLLTRIEQARVVGHSQSAPEMVNEMANEIWEAMQAKRATEGQVPS